MSEEKILYDCKGDNCWGNAISYDDKLVNELGAIQKFTGWKQRIPKLGDYIQVPMKSGKHFLFEVIEVRPTRDPPDMFFCSGKFLGYKEDLNEFKVKHESEDNKVLFFR